MNQFTTFCKAASSVKATEFAAFVSGVALGAQGTPKAIKESITKIQKATNGND
jgi:hypothetical protein